MEGRNWIYRFFIVLGQNPEVLRVFIIGCFIILALIVFIVASKLGWIKIFKLGKEGISLESKEKETLRQFESGNIHYIMNQQINRIDFEMMDIALDKSHAVRRALTSKLNTSIPCVSSRRALSACLRYPLYESVRRNNFKHVLRPENMLFYVNRLMTEIVQEYESYSVELSNNICSMETSNKCKQLPLLDNEYNNIRQQLIESWALPIRAEQVRRHQKKIETYKQFIPAFEQFQDVVMIKVCEICIDKNRAYIAALEKKPQGDTEL